MSNKFEKYFETQNTPGLKLRAVRSLQNGTAERRKRTLLEVVKYTLRAVDILESC